MITELENQHYDSNIDIPIVDILDACNRFGFHTETSCCGFEYPNQGIKDHTCPYILFYTSFAKITTFKQVLEGWWRIEYMGKDKWMLTRGCEHDFSTIRKRKRFQEDNMVAWKVVRKALHKLKVM